MPRQHSKLRTRSTPALTSLPPKILIRIIQNICPSNPQCPHSFISPSFSLAQTCSQFFLLHRLAIYHPRYFAILTPNCTPSCLRIFKKLASLEIATSTPIRRKYTLQLTFIDRSFAPSSVHQTEQGSSPNETMFKAVADIEEPLLMSLLKGLAQFRVLRQVVFREIPLPILECWEILKNIILLKEVTIEDSFACFDERALSNIAKPPFTHYLYISSQAVQDIAPIQEMAFLKHLSLRNMFIKDDQLRPVLSKLPQLQLLDVSDTDISPNVLKMVPKDITVLRAGIHTTFKERDPFLEIGTCVCDLVVKNGHLSACELSSESAQARFASAHESFLMSFKLPRLRELRWGRFTGFYQNGLMLRAFPGVKCIRLSGPEYGDEIFDNVKDVEVLELTGCVVTALGITKASVFKLIILNCPFLSLREMQNVQCDWIIWDKKRRKWVGKEYGVKSSGKI